MLYGELGAGKTLLTKGVMEAVGFDVDEVTSPSFALVNHYPADRFVVYHIDLWRLEPTPAVAMAVGLDEILEHENAVVIIEWADRLGAIHPRGRTIKIEIVGSGDDVREIRVDGLDEPVEFTTVESEPR